MGSLKYLFLILICIGIIFTIWIVTKIYKSQDLPLDQTVRIGNIREYSLFNAIAQNNGYFSSNGLSVQIIEYESGPAAIKDLLSGKLDIALASDNAGVQAIFTNPEIRIISEFVKNRVFSVVARKDRKISSVKDLSRKKIGVTRQSAGEYLFYDYLPFYALQPEEMTIIDLPPSRIKEEIMAGAIDAGVLFEPNVYNLKNSLGDQLQVWPIDNTYYTFGLIYVTEPFATVHKESVVRYLRSLVQAEKYFKEHSSETKSLVGKLYGYTNDYLDYSWPKNVHTIELSQELVLSLENIAAWAIKNKVTDHRTAPNYLDYIDFAPLVIVKPDAVSIIH